MQAQQHRSPPESLQKPNENHGAWLLRRIWDRINTKNKHFMGCIVGEEGDGKSYTAIKIASEVDPTFTTDRVIFEIAELLRILNNGEHEQGQFYVLDEAGVQFGNRTWQDRGQILANQALQLIRSHNLGLVFTIPRLGELDSQAEGRLQAFYEITDKVHNEHVEGKWKFLDPDRGDDSGEIYKHFPKRWVNGQLVAIERLSFKPPTGVDIERYEQRKDRFQDKQYEETIEELEGDEEDEQTEFDPKDLAMEIADGELGAYVSVHNQTKQPYINKDLIRAEHGISHSAASTVKSLLEKQFSKEELETHA